MKSDGNLNFKHLILVWAFAESGIGGFLHALKLPMTGIFVGGIAVVCIAMIGFFQEENNKKILEALSIVLLVKLAISPHSPWQAYVAVIFQGYLGYWIFRSKNNFSLKVFLFSILCLLESAIQKILITYFIFGTGFLKSIDAAAVSVFKSFQLNLDASLVMWVFGIYIAVHLLTGVFLGLWIPKIPNQLVNMKAAMPELFSSLQANEVFRNKTHKPIYWGILALLIILLLIKWLVPDISGVTIFWFFIRTLLISFGLIFIAGPLIRSLIIRKYKGKSIDRSILDETISEIPLFTSKAISLIKAINQRFTGLIKMKYFVLGLLIIAMDTKHKDA